MRSSSSSTTADRWTSSGARTASDGLIYILQARPETVKSQAGGAVEQRYKLKGDPAKRGTVLAEGRAIGQKIGTGPVRIVHSPAEMDRVQPGDVLVADMTDPNWEPVMKRASAIVTNRGGRTCHAAIIARELGIPAVVGCGDATESLSDGALVTVACSEGDTGYVFDGLLETEVHRGAARRDAVLPDQDHDERRQPDAGLRLRADARTPASAWRGWSSSSTTTSGCTRRRSSTTRTSTPN